MKTFTKILRILILTAFTGFVSFYYANSQTILFTEDWESAAIGQIPPSDWSVDLFSGNNYTSFVQQGIYPFCSPYSRCRMVEFNSFTALPGVQNRLKRTVPVSTSGYSYVTVDFEWHMDNGYFPSLTEGVYIQWSTNGSSWTSAGTLFRRYTDNPDIWVFETQPLPAGAANQPALYIALLFNSDFGYDCHLDLVHINGYSSIQPAATVTTISATGIMQTLAVLNGTVNANGSLTNASFQYGLTTAYGSSCQAGTVTGNTSTNISVSTASDLTPSALYHYRAVGNNAGGTAYGADLTFTTLAPALPTVITTAATDVSTTAATLNVDVNPNGDSTQVSFEYGLTTSYGSTSYFQTLNGSTLTPDSAGILGLTPNSIYHFRAKGVNILGTVYGNDMTFTTLPNGSPPTVYTKNAISITSNSADLNGIVIANGSSTAISFQYGLTTSYGNTISVGTGNGVIPLSADAQIYSLTAATTYHFRVVGTNAYGTSYGNDSMFRTLDTAPTVITLPATNITNTSATLNGTVNPNETTTSVSFEYGLTSSYGSTIAATPDTASCNAVQPVSAALTGLSSGTIYHYRVKGVNIFGTTYGNDMTFTTSYYDTSWKNVGSPGFSPGRIAYPSLKVNPVNGELYLAFMDSLNSHKATVMKFDGTNWVVVGNTGFSDYQAWFPSLAFNLSGEPYISFLSSWDAGALTVMKFDGENWINVGDPGFSTGENAVTSLAFSPSGEPHVAYIDWLTNKASVKKFNGTDWVYVGSGNFSAGQADNISLAFSLQGEPYVAFQDFANSIKATVMKFNGTSWVNVGNAGFSAGIADYTTLAFSPSGQPYVAFEDDGNYEKATVMKYDGNNWVIVGTPGFTAAVVVDISLAFNPVTGQPYVAYPDYGVNRYASVMKFNGINWVYVGDPGLSNGLVFNCSLAFNTYGKPYVAYDDEGNSGKATVKYYPVHDSCNHADYIAWPDSIQPLTIHFLDQSYGDIGSWYWNFGDDSTSTEKNPTHTYSASGMPYTVCLEVNSPDSICSNVHCATVLPGGLGCQAIFAHYPDTLHPFAVQFQDHSVWGVIQWHWDFGDGTTSIEQNPLHLFPHGGHFQVCLTIQTDPQYACGTTTCKDVYVWNASHCGGYFTYTSTNLLADFYGHSVNDHTETYSWNFGDNQTGQGQNTQHQYATAGAYNVVLSTVDSSGCTNDTAQTITITDTLAYLQVYGQVFGGGFPIHEGEVLIFSVDTVPPYQPYADVAGIDTNGVYYFISVPPGDYYLYGIPDNNSGYLPTYFGDVFYWEDANILHLGLPNNPYKIDLIQATDFLSGNGSINVHINVEGLKSTLLVDNITMLLMNSEQKTILYTKADNQGDFPFSSLAYGTYYLKAEIAGVKSDVIMVVLTPDNPQASIVMTFTGNRITDINEIQHPVSSFIIYPNPVSDNANIAMHLSESMDIIIKLFNLTGQQVFFMHKQMSAGTSVISIPVFSLPAGMYTVRIISGNGVQYISKLIR